MSWFKREVPQKTTLTIPEGYHARIKVTSVVGVQVQFDIDCYRDEETKPFTSGYVILDIDNQTDDRLFYYSWKKIMRQYETDRLAESHDYTVGQEFIVSGEQELYREDNERWYRSVTGIDFYCYRN